MVEERVLKEVLLALHANSIKYIGLTLELREKQYNTIKTTT